jgi:hypothetical protein
MRDKHSSNKILSTIIALVVALIGTTGLVVALHTPNAKVTVTPHQQQAQSEQPKPAPATRISYKGEDGKNALDLLKQHVHVTTKQSSYGEYVDSINGVQGGTGGKYWAFYVNGAQAPVGAGSYTTKSGDNIEWKFE